MIASWQGKIAMTKEENIFMYSEHSFSFVETETLEFEVFIVNLHWTCYATIHNIGFERKLDYV